MKIGEIASSVEYRMDEYFQILPNFDFLNWKKNFIIFLIFQIGKFWNSVNFPSCKVLEIR